jgi:predicted secreted hydrolase
MNDMTRVSRRRFLLTLPAAVASSATYGKYSPVRPGIHLVFPRDYGSHPGFRTEWWYVTGWLQSAQREQLGFQVTFFRSRPDVQEDNPSAFAPKQLLFAHAALADAEHGRLRRDQRSAREGFGLAAASTGKVRVKLEDWSLEQQRASYVTHIAARDFALDLRFMPTQPVLLQGAAGFSRKGPRPDQASYYYSLPHLAVSGAISREGKKLEVQGEGWFDHEWSSEYLPQEAAGWDWAGLNLADGSALMVFRMRGKEGRDVWAGGSWRSADGRLRVFPPSEIRFLALRHWRSPRTGAEYPIGMRIAAADLSVELDPLMDDQELDTRPSTGAIYWEGAVRVKVAGKEIGRGYLELTGYWSPLKL